MHPLRVARLFVWFTLMILSVWLVGCGALPFTAQPTRPAPPATLTSPPLASPTATHTPAASPTPVIALSTPVPQVTVAVPTAIPPSNLATVKLAVKDLPAGFQNSAASHLKSVNLTEEGLNAAFGKIGAQARVHNLTVFQHPQRAQVVASFLIHPLSEAERAALQTQLASADSALKAWGSALVGEAGVEQAQPLEGADKFGERSVGFTTTLQVLGVNIHAESVMILRGSVVQVVMSFYPEPVPPAIRTLDLAKLFDTRWTAALSGK